MREAQSVDGVMLTGLPVAAMVRLEVPASPVPTGTAAPFTLTADGFQQFTKTLIPTRVLPETQAVLPLSTTIYVTTRSGQRLVFQCIHWNQRV